MKTETTTKKGKLEMNTSTKTTDAREAPDSSVPKTQMVVPAVLPEDLTQAVSAYLMARTFAEVTREKVDAVARHLLASCTYLEAPMFRRGAGTPRRITDPKDTWHMTDEDSREYLTNLRADLEKAGFRIEGDGPDLFSYFCPALSAESVRRDTEYLVITAAARMLGQADPEGMNDRLLCHGDGLATRARFLDLAVRLVVNHPTYTAPKI